MRRGGRIKFQGNRFMVIVAVTFVLTVGAFVFGAFLALQTSKPSSTSTTPEVSSPLPSATPKPKATQGRKPRPLPPPNNQNQPDPTEDRD